MFLLLMKQLFDRYSSSAMVEIDITIGMIRKSIIEVRPHIQQNAKRYGNYISKNEEIINKKREDKHR